MQARRELNKLVAQKKLSTPKKIVKQHDISSSIAAHINDWLKPRK